MIFDDVVIISIFSVYSAERNKTSTIDQDHHHQHHPHPHHHHQQQEQEQEQQKQKQQHTHHQELILNATSVACCTSAIAIDTTTPTTALIATTSSLSSKNVGATIPLVATDALQTNPNPNKRLIMPKRRSYRNHNIRTSVVAQVTRSVRKRRPPGKLSVKQEQIDNSNTTVLNATYDISNAVVNVDRMVLNYPYNCMNCGRKYQTVSTLKRHMRSECNQPKKFVCRLCNRGFHHNFKLSDHLRRLHNIK